METLVNLMLAFALATLSFVGIVLVQVYKANRQQRRPKPKYHPLDTLFKDKDIEHPDI